MKRTILTLLVALGMADPAQATGGFTCRTAGARPIEVSIGFGHAVGAPLLRDATRLTVNGRSVPVTAPQWWFDGTELRLLLADPTAMRREAIVKARQNGRTFDGNLWRGGKRYWVRCRES
jgi:hypothetical protein